jgi:sporulation integral membrane protein YtvI
MRKFLVSLLYLGIAIGILYLATVFVMPYVLPFVLAALIAIVIDPVVNWVEKRIKSRGLAVLVVLCAVAGIIGALLAIGISRLVTELFDLSRSLPEYYKQGEQLVQDMTHVLSEFTAGLPTPVQSLMDTQMSRLYLAFEIALAALIDATRGLPNFLAVTAVTVIASFFVSRDKRLLLDHLFQAIPALQGDKVTEARKQVLESMIGYLKAEAMLVTVTMVTVTVALLVMGAGYALVMGLITGLLDVLPVLGPGLVFIPWALISFITGDTTFGFMLLALYAVVSAVRQLFESKIVGEKIGLHPLATLFAMYLGLKVFGALGIVIGPMGAVVLRAAITTGLLPGLPDSGELVPPQ